MKLELGDIWERHAEGAFVGITTNGVCNARGQAVMGRGVAKQAAHRFPRLPYDLGRLLKAHGNHAYRLTEYRVLTFPVKHRWWERADVRLIERSAREFMSLLTRGEQVYLVKPGCGNGGLEWRQVQDILAPILTDQVTIIDVAGGHEPGKGVGRAMPPAFTGPGRSPRPRFP